MLKNTISVPPCVTLPERKIMERGIASEVITEQPICKGGNYNSKVGVEGNVVAVRTYPKACG